MTRDTRSTSQSRSTRFPKLKRKSATPRVTITQSLLRVDELFKQHKGINNSLSRRTDNKNRNTKSVSRARFNRHRPAVVSFEGWNRHATVPAEPHQAKKRKKELKKKSITKRRMR